MLGPKNLRTTRYNAKIIDSKVEEDMKVLILIENLEHIDIPFQDLHKQQLVKIGNEYCKSLTC